MARTHILIAGASLSSLRAAEALVKFDSAVRVNVVGDEPWMPYNRPPLSKTASNSGRDVTELFDRVAFNISDAVRSVEWRLGETTVRADLAKREIVLKSGATIGFDGIIAATGLSPRQLPFDWSIENRFHLKSIDDAWRLSGWLKPGVRVAVIGAGILGCELAAAARAAGCDVTLIEPFGGPMEMGLGPELSAVVTTLDRNNGVTLVLGVSIADIRDHPTTETTEILMKDGSSRVMDVVVEAIGSQPNTAWLKDVGQDLEDEVMTDNQMAAIGADCLVAVGDVARFPNPLFDKTPRRIEHRCVPGQTATPAAASVLQLARGKAVAGLAFKPLPSFWGDQFGHTIQSFGIPTLGESREFLIGHPTLRGGIPEAGLAMGYWRGDNRVGIVAIGLHPSGQLELRAKLEQNLAVQSLSAVGA